MAKRILITGGAGFIGSHLADELLRKGYEVRALDNLSEQVHGPDRQRPEYLDDEVEFVLGDVRDPVAVKRALKGVDAVFHFAAAVGVGQSMYEIDRYADVNARGTAVLLEEIIKSGKIEKLIAASSMSIYGEGLYRSASGRLVHDASRNIDDLKSGEWDPAGPAGERLAPVGTPETKVPSLNSVYALSKYDQERLCLMIGRAYNIPTVAMRFFNVFGTRQAFSNPYTGVLAIFASRLMNNRPPLIYEDGLQMRDFVSVYDVAKACVLALESRKADYMSFNVGSGQAVAVSEVARRMANVFGKDIEPEITGKYRVGDIRHCFSDITLARKVLNYSPGVSLEDGILELSSWIEGRDAHDRVAQASAELASRGLTI